MRVEPFSGLGIAVGAYLGLGAVRSLIQEVPTLPARLRVGRISRRAIVIRIHLVPFPWRFAGAKPGKRIARIEAVAWIGPELHDRVPTLRTMITEASVRSQTSVQRPSPVASRPSSRRVTSLHSKHAPAPSSTRASPCGHTPELGARCRADARGPIPAWRCPSSWIRRGRCPCP